MRYVATKLQDGWAVVDRHWGIKVHSRLGSEAIALNIAVQLNHEGIENI